MVRTEFEVRGMSCAHCQAAVGRALQGVPGVVRAEVRLEGGRAEVTYDPQRASPAILARAVADAGYTLVAE